MRCATCGNDFESRETSWYRTADGHDLECDNCHDARYICSECDGDFASEHEKFSFKNGMCKACAEKLL